MAAPANTPKDIIQRISQEVQSICETQEVIDRIAAMGFTVTAGTPEAFAASYKRDMPIWEKLVKQFSGSSFRRRGRFDTSNPYPTWLHTVEFLIRTTGY